MLKDEHEVVEDVQPRFRMSAGVARQYPGGRFDGAAYVAWLRGKYPHLHDQQIRELSVTIRRPTLFETVLGLRGVFTPRDNAISILSLENPNRTLRHESEHFANKYRDTPDAYHASVYDRAFLLGVLAVTAVSAAECTAGVLKNNTWLLLASIAHSVVGTLVLLEAASMEDWSSPAEIAARQAEHEDSPTFIQMSSDTPYARSIAAQQELSSDPAAD